MTQPDKVGIQLPQLTRFEMLHLVLNREQRHATNNASDNPVVKMAWAERYDEPPRLGEVGSGVWLASSELRDFCDAQLAHSVVRPETELPITKKEMLDFSPAVIASGIVAELAGVISDLKNQSNDLFLLRFRNPNDERRGLAGKNWLVGARPMHAQAVSPIL